MKTIKNMIKIIFIFLFIVTISNITNAASGNFKSFNNAPRMWISVNSSKYDDVKIYITDYSGLKEENIKFYEVKRGNKGKEIKKDKKFIKKVETEQNDAKTKNVKYIYTISKKYLNKKTKILYLEVVDKNNSASTLKTTFRINNDGKNKRYKADPAPRLKNFKTDGNYLYFTVRDRAGESYVKVYDNFSKTPSKEILNKKNLPKGNTQIKIKLSKLETQNEKYELKVIAQDNNKTEKQKATRVFRFKLADKFAATKKAANDKNQEFIEKESVEKIEEKAEEKASQEFEGTVSAIKLDRDVLLLDNAFYNNAQLEATTTPKELNSRVTWTSSKPTVATVNNKGKVTAKKYGTTIITAKITDNSGKTLTAKCEVSVFTKSSDKTYYTHHPSGGSNSYFVENKGKNKWTYKQVESYINNAAKLAKENPSKYKGTARTVKCYFGGTPENNLTHPSASDSRMYTYPLGRKMRYLKKPKGQIDFNGYIMFFSTKKQWLYLLKKQSDGTFKVIKDARSSGAANIGNCFSGYLAGIHTSTELGYSNRTYMWAIYERDYGSRSLYANSMHLRKYTDTC